MILLDIAAKLIPRVANKATLYLDRASGRLRATRSDGTTWEGEDTARKNQPNGYPGLDENGHIAYDQLGTGEPDGTKFLRDDGTWAVPPGGGGGTSDHALLSHLAWTASAHTGTANRFAVFGVGGAAAELAYPSTGLVGWTGTAWQAVTVSAPLGYSAGTLSLSYGTGLTVSGGALVVDTSVIATIAGVASYAQPLDSGLTSLTAADASAGLPYVTGANVWANASYSGMFSVVSGAWKVIGLRESGGTDLSIGGISGTKLLGVQSNTIGGVTVGTGLSLAAGVLSLNGTSPSNTDFNPVFAKFFAITTDGDSLRGDGMTVTTGGTLAAANTTTRPFTSLSTATTLSATATAYTQTAACRMGFAGTLYFRIQTASSIASIRFWLGLRQSSGGIGTGATAGCPIVCLSYDSSVSGNWRIVNKDSTTQTAVDSGVAVATSTEYYGYIRTDSSGSYLAIAVAGAALPAEVANTSNPPSSTTDLGVSCTVVNLSAGTARRMDLNSIYYIARY